MIVLKFGGTSVGNAENIKKVVAIITKVKEPCIVVLSAVSGTTNTLVVLNRFILEKKIKEANSLLEKLKREYEIIIEELYISQNYKDVANQFIENKCKELANFIDQKENNYPIIVAQGELISTQLVQFYMEEKKVSSRIIPALDFMFVDENEEPILSKIETTLSTLVQAKNKQKIYITQGFICRDSTNKISNLKRGGSDYTASIIGAALQTNEIQIWTDIDGMHNNDPRFVENTFSVEEISFNEAAELAYFGAKILHPQSIFPAKKYNIPVRIKNTFYPSKKGTLISNSKATTGVTAIAAKDGITAIKIKSYRMLMAYGFLKNVFEVFENHTTAIDMITTSEVAVSLTIDNTTHLKNIIKELETFGEVQVDSNLSIVCITGDFSENTEGMAVKVLQSIANCPIRMISYGGSNYNMSLVINTDEKKKVLNDLNDGLFLN